MDFIYLKLVLFTFVYCCDDKNTEEVICWTRNVQKKVKLSRYRPGQVLGVSRRLRLQNF
jgi:hypothetical protein